MATRIVENGEYTTRDLYYAAFLKAAGVPFKDTRKKSDHTVFVFERTDTLSEMKTGYYSRSLKVAALTYADEIKVLKTMIHQE